jgi:archaellum component FlaC
MAKDLKDISRNLNFTGDKPDKETILLSATVRIADAVELMSDNYSKMVRDVAWYMKRYHEQLDEIDKLKGTIRNLKGQVTKAKKSIK